MSSEIVLNAIVWGKAQTTRDDRKIAYFYNLDVIISTLPCAVVTKHVDFKTG